MNTGIRYNYSFRNQVHQVKEETQELATTAQTGIRYNSSNRNQVQHGIQDLGTTDKTGNRYNRQNRNQVQHRKQELDKSGIEASVWECCKETWYSINPANFELPCRQFWEMTDTCTGPTCTARPCSAHTFTTHHGELLQYVRVLAVETSFLTDYVSLS